MTEKLGVRSKNGVPLRLTEERWSHIATEHAELAEMRDDVRAAVSSPDRVLSGSAGELLAVRRLSSGKFLVVVYRETGADGFIITAFLTSRERSLNRRTQLWPPT